MKIFMQIQYSLYLANLFLLPYFDKGHILMISFWLILHTSIEVTCFVSQPKSHMSYFGLFNILDIMRIASMITYIVFAAVDH